MYGDEADPNTVLLVLIHPSYICLTRNLGSGGELPLAGSNVLQDQTFTNLYAESDHIMMNLDEMNLDDRTTRHRQELVERHPLQDSGRAVALFKLASSLRNRVLENFEIVDMDEAITLYRSALDLFPANHPYRPNSLSDLALCLHERYKKYDTIADLEEAIMFDRAALKLRPPGHCYHGKSLSNLAVHLTDRFLKNGSDADIDEAISLHRSALDLRPDGHPRRLNSIRWLSFALWKRYNKRATMVDLEEARAMLLELHHPGSPFHTDSLYYLAEYLKDRFLNKHIDSYLDEAILLHRSVLDCLPGGHSDRSTSLKQLADCLRRRFPRKDAIADLDEAIALYREILDNCPSGSPAYASHLHELGRCLCDRFTKLETITDLHDAIKLEEAALDLRPPGHPDHAESLDSLTNYRQLRINAISPSTRLTGPTVDPRTNKLIGEVVFEVLKGFPPRLLNIHTGMLCDRDSQISHFEKSQEYDKLLTSASVPGTLRETSRIRSVVSTYFRYATLSHRWGKFEPLLRDIEGKVVYDLDPTDGLSKLQNFCCVSCLGGYLWAWSDTCCIDKESSAELQEAIGSMFSWYRHSALTIVYLADVSSTDSLTGSGWFKRGWTLQELLAPQTMLFFTRNWDIYKGVASNHKSNSIIIGELEQATGIASRYLTHFYPGVEDARLRLQWASQRCTSRPEDIAYSLCGIFSLHIPVLYGESAENALARLLAEVIKKSGDASILDWMGQSSTFHSYFPATITAYQTLAPPQPLPTELKLPTLGIRKLLVPRYARKMHQALSNLPPMQFINFRLSLPCIVYRVKTITVTTRVGTTTAAHYVHQIQAEGLVPMEVALSEVLKNISRKGVPYVLIRPWHSNLVDPSVSADDDAAQQWLMRMGRPFSALLLAELPQNKYRRVGSSCKLTACPTNSAGVLKGEVSTLTIE